MVAKNPSRGIVHEHCGTRRHLFVIYSLVLNPWQSILQEQVVVSIGIKEMYIGVPENRLSLTVIESISTDGSSIPPVVIVPERVIIESWFHDNMTGHELITVSPSGYTNEGIYMSWLDHFIYHQNCGHNQPWRVLLIDGACCHEAPEFIIKAKMHHILGPEHPFTPDPSHLTVGCGLFSAMEEIPPKCSCEYTPLVRTGIQHTILLSRSAANSYANLQRGTIKYFFKNAEIWPASFKVIQKKKKAEIVWQKEEKR
jgi:hypothetical protein